MGQIDGGGPSGGPLLEQTVRSEPEELKLVEDLRRVSVSCFPGRHVDLEVMSRGGNSKDNKSGTLTELSLGKAVIGIRFKDGAGQEHLVTLGPAQHQYTFGDYVCLYIG